MNQIVTRGFGPWPTIIMRGYGGVFSGLREILRGFSRLSLILRGGVGMEEVLRGTSYVHGQQLSHTSCVSMTLEGVSRIHGESVS